MPIDLSRLNPRQREAAELTEGPVLVLAGAGSGKTSVLTYRIARLVEDRDASPSSIIAITFTNKAAREMRQRVEALTPRGNGVWVSTFHAACAKMLRLDGEKLGYTRSFTIFDADDQLALIKRIVKDMRLNPETFPPQEIRYVISHAKNDMITPEHFFETTRRDFKSQHFADIYFEYDKRLKEQNAMDFDDLLLKTLQLLTDHPPVLDYYRRRFDYVMVDEAQDVNDTQYELVKLLAGRKRNLFMVGDDDQSIYAWRGADISIILGFEKDFPETRVIKLEQNYRSTSTILDAANAVIRNNIERKDKTLWSARDRGDKITLCKTPNERAEAQYVMGRIGALMREGQRPGDMAILYRVNALSRVPEEQLMQAGLPYRVYGGLKFYDRKEVRDIISYLRIIVNPLDEAGMLRVINTPRRGIGDATVEAVRTLSRRRSEPFFITLLNLDEESGLSSRALYSVKRFADLLGEFMALKMVLPPVELLNTLLERINYDEHLDKEGAEEAQNRRENVSEFLTALGEYQKGSDEPSLEDFLETVALVTDVDTGAETPDVVTLMSLHSAKGLEFPNVFILGCEEGVFPHSRALFDEVQMEEERRLFYVGVTRAKDRLFLTHAVNRTAMGKTNANSASRFLSEVPDELMERENRMPGWEGPSAEDSKGVASPARPSIMPRRPMRTPKPFAVGQVKAGDRVRHAVHGEGTVVDAKPEGGDTLLKVAIPGRGIKVFMASELGG